MYAVHIGNRRFRRSLVGYRRREVEDALDASDRALAEARAATEERERELRSRERELRSRERELGWQRKQIDELDRVAGLLAKRVVEHRKERDSLRAELADRRGEASDRADLRPAVQEPEGEFAEPRVVSENAMRRGLLVD